jgi:hypothetical protein
MIVRNTLPLQIENLVFPLFIAIAQMSISGDLDATAASRSEVKAAMPH